MMAAFVFTVGTLDLSGYLDVQESDGLDPFGDPLAPQFGESPLADYQPLIGVTASNREGIWPLVLKATDKDTLHDLVAAIRAELDKPRPLTVEWRDSGATQSTFFDIEYGKLIPKTRYWLQTHNYAQVTLHLFVRPYGHTGTQPFFAAASSPTPILSPILKFQVSPVSGDVNALPLTTLIPQRPGPFGASLAVYVGYSVLPDASYMPEFRAASLVDYSGIGTLIGASGALASQTLVLGVPTGGVGSAVVVVRPPIPSLYAGENRVLALVRPGSQPVSLTLLDHLNRPCGPTALATGPAHFGTVDLGIVRVDPDLGAIPSMGWKVACAGPATSAATISITGLVVLPEETTTFVTDDLGGGAYIFDSVLGRVYAHKSTPGGTPTALKVDSNTPWGLESALRGRPPTLPPGSTQTVAAFSLPAQSAATVNADAASLSGTVRMSASVQARERFSYVR